MQSHLSCFMQKKYKEFENMCLLLLQMWKIKKKVFKNLQQHSKGCPERALSLQTILALQSMICCPGCSYTLNQSPFCPSTMHLRALSDLCWCKACSNLWGTACRWSFLQKPVMKEATFPMCKVSLVPTFLCAYPLILTTLRGPLSNQVFVYSTPPSRVLRILIKNSLKQTRRKLQTINTKSPNS